MTTQPDLHHAHLFAQRYTATLRYLPTPGCNQWHGLVRCTSVLRALHTQPDVALFLLPVVFALLNLRHRTLLLRPMLLSLFSGTLRMKQMHEAINAKAVEGCGGLWKVSGGLWRVSVGLKMAHSPSLTPFSAHTSGGLAIYNTIFLFYLFPRIV